MLKRILREPLLHFTAIAVVIFAANAALGGDQNASQPIVVSAAKVEQLAALFAKSWRRPPGADELKGLVDDYITEEIYTREAKAIGLDIDDTVIRRRLRQKMEFLNDAAAETGTPTQTDLAAFLTAHPDQFATEPMIAFRQVFLRPDRHGNEIGGRAAAILKVLAAGGADPVALGDPTLLEPGAGLTAKHSIAQVFGPAFADALEKVEPGDWTGPIPSSFGLHLVQITERKAGQVPPLGEIREAVIREWRNERRQVLAAERLAALRERYEVVIEMPALPPGDAQ